MLILKTVALNKYNNIAKFAKKDEGFYELRNQSKYRIAFYTELEEGETLEDPLMDLIEKYKMKKASYSNYTEVDGKRLYIFELETNCEDPADNLAAMKKVVKFVGKRIYNAEVGEFLELKIKPIKED